MFHQGSAYGIRGSARRAAPARFARALRGGSAQAFRGGSAQALRGGSAQALRGGVESPQSARRRAAWGLLLLGLALAVLVGCAGTHSYHLLGEPEAPGADAELAVEDKQGNHEITLRVKELLPPGRVHAGARHYAVWVKPAKHGCVHLGNLNYDAESRAGALTAISPHSRFLFTVTAEAEKTPRKPQGPVVLRQKVAAP